MASTHEKKNENVGSLQIQGNFDIQGTEMEDCQVIIQDESCTLKTSGRCDAQNMNLGGKDSFFSIKSVIMRLTEM